MRNIPAKVPDNGKLGAQAPQLTVDLGDMIVHLRLLTEKVFTVDTFKQLFGSRVRACRGEKLKKTHRVFFLTLFALSGFESIGGALRDSPRRRMRFPPRRPPEKAKQLAFS